MGSKLPALTDPFCGGFLRGYMQMTFLRTTPPLHKLAGLLSLTPKLWTSWMGPLQGVQVWLENGQSSLTGNRILSDSIPHLSDTPTNSPPCPLILEEFHPPPSNIPDMSFLVRCHPQATRNIRLFSPRQSCLFRPGGSKCQTAWLKNMWSLPMEAWVQIPLLTPKKEKENMWSPSLKTWFQILAPLLVTCVA